MSRTGFVAIAVTSILSLLLLGGCSSEDTKGTAASAESIQQTPTVATARRELAVGETAAIHDLEVTVVSATNVPAYTVDKTNYLAKVNFKNAARGPNSFSQKDWTLEYADGRRSIPSAVEGIRTVHVAPGETVEVEIYFIKEDDVAKVVYTPAIFDWRPEVTTWQVK